MPTLHVIYDEKDDVPLPPRRPGVSSALLVLPEFYKEHEMEEAAKDLALKLLRHHYGFPQG